ncbi:hypothetical protein C2G38_2093591 [Gigaspora rosea]|uniref:Uncharacterized protein n=1 Tax=Gigaspora rosea TaxID=44941 RepID=A0A397V2S0_9GLOM|nr:hypothetical protein C2G38_2093591 [Gigaspora rosea]
MLRLKKISNLVFFSFLIYVLTYSWYCLFRYLHFSLVAYICVSYINYFAWLLYDGSTSVLLRL